MLFFNLRKKKVENRLKNWDQEKEVIKYERAFRKISKGGRPKISTSKIVLATLIIILAVVMIFAGYATVAMINIVAITGVMFDFSPLTALIGAIAGEVVITLGYFAKSAKENCESGIRYQAMMNEFELQKGENDGVG